MMILYGTSGLFLLLFQLIVWLPAPITSLNATSLIQAANNGDGKEARRIEKEDRASLQALERVTHRIRPGDTLGALLEPFALSGEEKLLWVRSIRQHFSPKRLRPGREIYFYLSANEDAGTNGNGHKSLQGLSLELDDDWILAWELGEREINFRKYERPYEAEILTASGTITDSLYQSGERAGLHPEILSQLVDIFGWDVNFQSDLRAGDSFRVLYERKYRAEGKKKEFFRVLAAELGTGNERHFAFYFEKEDGEGDYYNLQGKSLARAFLRYPVQFNRISSTFSHRRYHPILKVRRPHLGVDFVAARGTPVRAVGDGRVTYAGWKSGGYGRFIEIRHGATYKSRYAHLNGYAPSVGRGARVKKGQVIGYVGCSGRCTGSHLHFEMYKNHRYVNPLKFQLPREDRIEPPLLEVFETAKQLVMTQLVSTTGSKALQPSKADHWR
ncbi:MAG TPA: peptidoglycan DD-metalloendopeptidase family protein [Candidatus Binatia bacterium]